MAIHEILETQRVRLVSHLLKRVLNRSDWQLEPPTSHPSDLVPMQSRQRRSFFLEKICFLCIPLEENPRTLGQPDDGRGYASRPLTLPSPSPDLTLDHD